MISYGLLCLALTTATLPNVAELKPGQLPLLMAIVGCAVLLIGVATEALRTRRQEMDQVVQALRTRSAELARAANRMAALQRQLPGLESRPVRQRGGGQREAEQAVGDHGRPPAVAVRDQEQRQQRSEEHTSELQSLMRISSAAFCLK